MRPASGGESGLKREVVSYAEIADIPALRTEELMTHQSAKLLWAAVLFAALWGAAPAQQPNEAAAEGRATLETIDKRLAAVERLLAAMAKAETVADSVAIGARLDRLENRITRIETENSRYRPGAPAIGSLSMLESRLRSLESEVARMRR